LSAPFPDIAEAFSRTAEKYDRFAEDHPNLTRMRALVYSHLLRFVRPGARILELNSGTGTDAVYLALQGFSVHATDIAPGMLVRLKSKVDNLSLDERVSLQECSFTDLAQITGGPYDAVFSNLGGLNCISDLSVVVRQLPGVLRTGGVVTWVILPPVCLWELALALSGNFKVAFRRLNPSGTWAHLEGKYFPIHYFTPRQVIATFGPRYKLLSLQGLSIFAPPAESKNLAISHPRLYQALCWLDERLAWRAPFNGWGDFFIISFRFLPESWHRGGYGFS